MPSDESIDQSQAAFPTGYLCVSTDQKHISQRNNMRLTPYVNTINVATEIKANIIIDVLWLEKVNP